MENTCGNNTVKNDLFVRVKATKSPKYKAPAELSDKVKMIAIEVTETETETSESIEVNLHFQVEGKLTKADSGKTA